MATAATAALWLLIVVTALALAADHANSPNSAGTPPIHWPVHSKISLEASRPTLLVFAHPHCPCTRASIGELAKLMAHCHGQVSVHVLFLNPPAMTQDWSKTDLWHTAAAIPGVNVHSDYAGVEARLFHSKTSGHTLLYDRDGNLMFQGGLTISRGHSGDSPGCSAILAFLHGKLSQQTKTAVFGCSLFEVDCHEDGAESNK